MPRILVFWKSTSLYDSYCLFFEIACMAKKTKSFSFGVKVMQSTRISNSSSITNRGLRVVTQKLGKVSEDERRVARFFRKRLRVVSSTC